MKGRYLFFEVFEQDVQKRDQGLFDCFSEKDKSKIKSKLVSHFLGTPEESFSFELHFYLLSESLNNNQKLYDKMKQKYADWYSQFSSDDLFPQSTDSQQKEIEAYFFMAFLNGIATISSYFPNELPEKGLLEKLFNTVYFKNENL